MPLERMRDFGRERDNQIVRNKEMRERQNIFVEGRWKLESWREYEELKKMKKNKKKMKLF